MKKGILTIIIAAFTFINLVLTSIMIFAVVPAMNDTTRVIQKISNIIDLETNTSSTVTSEVPIDKLKVYDIDEKLTISLQNSGNTAHYAVIYASLSLNTQHADYEKYGSKISEKEALIKSYIIDIVSQHTIDDMRNNQDEIRQEILEKIRDAYDSDFVYEVVFSNVTLQ